MFLLPLTSTKVTYSEIFAVLGRYTAKISHTLWRKPEINVVFVTNENWCQPYHYSSTARVYFMKCLSQHVFKNLRTV